MRQITCIRAFGSFRPGDTSEIPDDAAASPQHWAESGPAEAAAAEASVAALAAPEPPAGDGAQEAPASSPAVSEPPLVLKAADLAPASKEGA